MLLLKLLYRLHNSKTLLLFWNLFTGSQFLNKLNTKSSFSQNYCIDCCVVSDTAIVQIAYFFIYLLIFPFSYLRIVCCWSRCTRWIMGVRSVRRRRPFTCWWKVASVLCSSRTTMSSVSETVRIGWSSPVIKISNQIEKSRLRRRRCAKQWQGRRAIMR